MSKVSKEQFIEDFKKLTMEKIASELDETFALIGGSYEPTENYVSRDYAISVVLALQFNNTDLVERIKSAFYKTDMEMVKLLNDTKETPKKTAPVQPKATKKKTKKTGKSVHAVVEEAKAKEFDLNEQMLG